MLLMGIRLQTRAKALDSLHPTLITRGCSTSVCGCAEHVQLCNGSLYLQCFCVDARFLLACIGGMAATMYSLDTPSS